MRHRADRRIRIRYPGGETDTDTLAHRGSTELYLSGGFKKWYHSNLELGDRIWLRVLEGDTPESAGLEVGRTRDRIRRNNPSITTRSSPSAPTGSTTAACSATSTP